MSFKTRSEPGKLPAGILAILVHIVFFALLIFGVTWRTQNPAPVMVDLWSRIPAPSKVAEVEPPPKKRQEIQPRQPEPKPQAKPEPQPKAQSEPKLKPDIALKEKEQKKKLEEEKRRKEEELQKEKELERKKEEERKLEEEREKQETLKAEQAKKLAQQKEAQARAQAEQAAQAAADAKVGDYVAKIQAKIRSNTVIPPDVVGNPEVVYEITLLPTGEILSVRLVKSSGISSYDAAAERAIRKSAPLPIPKDDPPLFASKFRVGNYSFRPND